MAEKVRVLPVLATGPEIVSMVTLSIPDGLGMRLASGMCNLGLKVGCHRDRVESLVDLQTKNPACR